ncbi:MAG: winged helix-turn-helix transcriptional regulator [Cellulophaga sp.]
MVRTPDEKAYLKLLSFIEEDHSKSEIARFLKVSPTAVGKRIKRLVKYGYITEDTKGWIHILKLTPKGIVSKNRGSLTLSRYVRERRGRPKKMGPPPKGMIVLQNLQILIPILKEGRPLPIKKTNDLNNWTQKLLDLPAPIPATVELTTQNVRLYAHRIYVSRGYAGYLELSQKVLNTVTMVRSCLAQFGWIIDDVRINMVNQEIATTMPEFDHLNLTQTEIYLGRKAKDLQGKDMGQEARVWMDWSEKKLPSGKIDRTLEFETNDAEYAQDLQLMNQRMGLENMTFDEGLLLLPQQISRVSADIRHIGKFATSHEQFMVTFATGTLPELNSTLNAMGKLIKKLDKRLDKL